jgi:hypothetical protein
LVRVGPFLDASQRVVGILNVYAGVPPLPPTPVRFPTVGHTSCSPLFYLGRNLDLLAGSRVCWKSLILFSAMVFVFCFPPIGAVTLEVVWLRTPLARRSCLVSSIGRGDQLLQNVLALIFWCLAPRSTACSSRACLRASFTVFFPKRSSIFMVGSSARLTNALSHSLLMWSSGSAGLAR